MDRLRSVKAAELFLYTFHNIALAADSLPFCLWRLDIKPFTRKDSGRGENKSACADLRTHLVFYEHALRFRKHGLVFYKYVFSRIYIGQYIQFFLIFLPL